MIYQKNIKCDNIVIFGDLHGHFNDIVKFTKKHDIKNTVFLGVGDFGIIGQDKTIVGALNHINPNLIKNNNFVYTIRGNHDNPSYFESKFQIGNIQLLPDYSILTINGINFLMVGGAISVDRLPNKNFRNTTGKKSYGGRKIGVDYWENENFVYNENILNSIEKKIDCVITHSCTNFNQPLVKSNIELWAECDKNLMVDVDNERNSITKLYNYLIENEHPLKSWFYGHFHFNHVEVLDSTKFVLIDKNDFYEFRH